MDSTALALTLAGFGVLLIAISYQRHRNHRDPSALLHGVSGSLLFLSGALLLAVTLNFNTYATLRPGEPLAELSLEKSGANSFQARLLRIPAGDLQVFTLQGDRWDMQARLLEWHGWATWLGLSNNIRLEQLNSISTGKKNTAANAYANSYSLSRNPGINLWAWQAQHPERFTVLSTRALQTDSLPLQNGLRFHLYLIDGVLVARQINTPGSPTRNNANVPSVPLPDFVKELNRQTQSSRAAADVAGDVSVPTATTAPQATPPTSPTSSAVLD